MAIDWSPLVAQQAVRNQGQQEAFYEMGDKVGNYFGNKPKGRSLLDKMTDQEGLFQGGFNDGKKRNRLFGRTRDAIEGSGKLGFNALKNASKLPGQFIKGIRDNRLNNGSSEERPDKKSLLDYIKGINLMDDGLSENAYETDYSGESYEEEPNNKPGGLLQKTNNYNPDVQPLVSEDGGMTNSYNDAPVAIDDSPFGMDKDKGMFATDKPTDEQEGMQMNMQYLQQQYPNLQLGSMQPGQSYTINLGDGQGMQSFQWGIGPMFGGQ